MSHQTGARVIQVIETTLELRGKGVTDDPFRRVTQYWTLDGVLLAEVDPTRMLENIQRNAIRPPAGYHIDGR